MKYIFVPLLLSISFFTFSQKYSGISLYEKLYNTWKIIDSNNIIVPYNDWDYKVKSGNYILAEHPYNARKRGKNDTCIKQLILLDEDTKLKRAAFKKFQLANITFNIKGAMPKFEIADCVDTLYNNYNLLGKPFVLYICCFGSCTQSLWELAEANKLFMEYKDSGVVFLVINYDKKDINLKQIIANNNLKIAMANSNKNFEKIIETLGEIPMRIVVNKLGQVVHKTNTYSYMEDGDESLYTYAIRTVLAKCIAQQ